MDVLIDITLLLMVTMVIDHTTSSSTCARLSVPEVLSVNVGKVLADQSYLNLTANKLVVCGGRCMRQKKCKSINYNAVTKECTLNYKSHTSAPSSMVDTPNNDLTYFSVKQWPQEFVTLCRYHKCPEDKLCVSTTSGTSPYTCVDDPDSTTLGECTITSSCADCMEDRVHGGNIYQAVGCYTSSTNVLPTYIQNMRGTIDWTDAGSFGSIIDKCAELTSNYEYFGIEFYGECWAGNTDDANFPSSEIQMSECSSKCNYLDKGVGSSSVMFVYKWM